MGGAGQLLSAIGWVSSRILPKHLSSVQRDDDRTLKDCEDITSKQLGGEGSLFKSGVCDVEHIYVVCSIKCESVNGSDMISMTGSDLMWSCVRSQWCSGDASWMMGI